MLIRQKGTRRTYETSYISDMVTLFRGSTGAFRDILKELALLIFALVCHSVLMTV